jgi:hypothetical protein
MRLSRSGLSILVLMPNETMTRNELAVYLQRFVERVQEAASAGPDRRSSEECRDAQENGELYPDNARTVNVLLSFFHSQAVSRVSIRG